MVFTPESKIRLCVKSVKTATGTVQTERDFRAIPLDHPSRVKVEGKVADARAQRHMGIPSRMVRFSVCAVIYESCDDNNGADY